MNYTDHETILIMPLLCAQYKTCIEANTDKRLVEIQAILPRVRKYVDNKFIIK